MFRLFVNQMAAKPSRTDAPTRSRASIKRVIGNATNNPYLSPSKASPRPNAEGRTWFLKTTYDRTTVTPNSSCHAVANKNKSRRGGSDEHAKQRRAESVKRI